MRAPMQPTRARHTMLGFALAAMAVAYLDRVCISTAAPAIKADLGLSDVQMGTVFSAFTLAYALFEVPSGWLADRFGARADTDTDRGLVVGDDGGHRRRDGIRLPGDAARALRHGRSGRHAEPHACLRALAPGPRAGPRLRAHDHGRSARRSGDATDRGVAARPGRMASRVRDLRVRRRRVGCLLVPLVPRRAARSHGRERRRARADRLEPGGRRAPARSVATPAAQPHHAGALRDVLRGDLRLVLLSRPGCRPICCARAASI